MSHRHRDLDELSRLGLGPRDSDGAGSVPQEEGGPWETRRTAVTQHGAGLRGWRSAESGSVQGSRFSGVPHPAVTPRPGKQWTSLLGERPIWVILGVLFRDELLRFCDAS